MRDSVQIECFHTAERSSEGPGFFILYESMDLR